jgi:hypothetical protein
VVLYGCETLSSTLREVHGLGVFAEEDISTEERLGDRIMEKTA